MIEIYNGNNKINTIDLDKTKIGKTNIREYRIYNNSEYPVEEITITSDDKDVEISHPLKLNPHESSNITVKFSPSLTRGKNILSGKLQISGFDVIG